jgi:apolipoprotein D and lipocalin family protein
MSKTQKFIFSICLIFFIGKTRAEPHSILDTVKTVDLQKYQGKWYEIASYPQRFQKGCTGTTATYELRDDGRITVINQCFKNALDGPLSKITGKAWVPNPDEPGKLKVRFFWPFSGDYWIIDLDPDYQWAVVGSPSRKYLWFLSRAPKISDELFENLLKSAENKGFTKDKLQKTIQGDPN